MRFAQSQVWAPHARSLELVLHKEQQERALEGSHERVQQSALGYERLAREQFVQRCAVAHTQYWREQNHLLVRQGPPQQSTKTPVSAEGDAIKLTTGDGATRSITRAGAVQGSSIATCSTTGEGSVWVSADGVMCSTTRKTSPFMYRLVHVSHTR